MPTVQPFDVSQLTLNPQEAQAFSEFIAARVAEQPALSEIHDIHTGVKMKEQIVIDGELGKTGVAASADSCGRTSSGAKVQVTQKYWEPVQVEDLFVNCQKNVNSLFKPYFLKDVRNYRDLYNIEGSDQMFYMAKKITDSITKSASRIAWFGDTDVEAATAGAAGLKDGDNAKFYNMIDGLWKQIFDDGTGSPASQLIGRYTIEKNTPAGSPAAISDLSAGESVTIFEGLWAAAKPALRQDKSAVIMVTRPIFENYRQYLQTKGENFSIDYTMDGIPSLRWNGVKVVNMELIWDVPMEDFEYTTDGLAFLPYRAVFTSPSNIPVATLEDGDLNSLESWYNQDERVNKFAFGYTIDAKVIQEDHIVVAY